MTETQRDPNFYFSFRTFQVEDTLFRVPRHLFLMPKADIKPVRQGTDNEDDLVVLGEEFKKDDFLQLLRAVYPRHYNTPEELSPHQWQAVLRLSKTFQLDDVRQKAARNLKSLFFAGDPVDALLCAKENNLEDWMEPLVNKIVGQKRELSDKELENIGTRIAMKIAWAQGAACSPLPEIPIPGIPDPEAATLDTPIPEIANPETSEWAVPTNRVPFGRVKKPRRSVLYD